MRSVRGIRASVIGIQRMACAEGGNRVLYNITMRWTILEGAGVDTTCLLAPYLPSQHCPADLQFLQLASRRSRFGLCPTRLQPRSCSEGCERLTSLHSWCGGMGAADWAGRVYVTAEGRDRHDRQPRLQTE